MKGCPVFSIKSTWCFSVYTAVFEHLIFSVLRKVIFHVGYLQWHEKARDMWPLPRQVLTSSWRHEIMLACVHVTDDDGSFCAPECWYVKPQSRALTALDYGFVPVKRWLLIACDTALYTIVLHKCLCRTMIWSAYYMYMYNETIRVLLKQKVTSASATYMVSFEATRVNLIKRETTNMDTQADSQQSFP